MRNNNKQAMKAKNSNLYAPIFKCQALYFGWLKITKNFTNREDANAWYDKHQQGWRYRHAVAVVWHAKLRTPDKHLKNDLVGGDAWKLAKEGRVSSQAQCDYLLYSTDYELVKA